MPTVRCTFCNAPRTESLTLKLCGNCKAVSCCGPICQRANWKVHKLACQPHGVAGGKEVKDLITRLHEAYDVFRREKCEGRESRRKSERKSVAAVYGFTVGRAILKDYQRDSHGNMIVPGNGSSIFKRMPATAEQSVYHCMMAFDSDFLAKIAHLTREEHQIIKSDLAHELWATSPAQQQAADREEIGEFIQKWRAREAAMEATEDVKGE